MHEMFEVIDVFDPSDAPLHPSIRLDKVRKVERTTPGHYSFMTCMHVLEHVGHPQAFLAEAAATVRPGGLIYIEVPHEQTDQMRRDFEHRIVDTPIIIHEHLNKFDRHAIPALISSLPDLNLLDETEELVSMGWTEGVIGRFLAERKR